MEGLCLCRVEGEFGEDMVMGVTWDLFLDPTEIVIIYNITWDHN